MKSETKNIKTEGEALALKIVQLKHECGERGYYKTMHEMEHAVKSIGWEIAAKIDVSERSL